MLRGAEKAGSKGETSPPISTQKSTGLQWVSAKDGVSSCSKTKQSIFIKVGQGKQV